MHHWLLCTASGFLLKIMSYFKVIIWIEDPQTVNFRAEDECDNKMQIQRDKHTDMRLDVTNLLADLDKEYIEHYAYRH